MKPHTLATFLLVALLPATSRTCAQSNVDYRDAGTLQAVPAVSGHEEELAALLKSKLLALSPRTDSMGNVFVTIGNGAPHRLIATAIDEPGYVVSEIREDGYLRVQRLPQSPPNSVFDSLQFAQPVWVITRKGKKVAGVFAGLSVHLQSARINSPEMNQVEQLYVDIGATSASDVLAAGVDVLDSVALQREHLSVGDGWAGPAVGDRVGCEVLLQLLSRFKDSVVKGTTTFAFATQQWSGGRGLHGLLTELSPDEFVFLGRVAPAQLTDKDGKQEARVASAGVLLGVSSAGKQTESFVEKFKNLAEQERIPLQVLDAAAPRIAGYGKGAAFPEKSIALGVPLLWPVTPAEFIAASDSGYLERLLESYLDIAKPTGGMGGGLGSGHTLSLLEALVESYGASGHESAVRKTILNRLPDWAAKKTTIDAAGNLVLHLGDGKKDANVPSIAFLAHMDELGYEVKKIESDGRLQVDALGGGYPQYFVGHVALVHKQDGNAVGAVMELPDGWERFGFAFAVSNKSIDESARVYVGTHSKGDTEKLGIAPGDYVTIPKEYHRLLGTRANARSFDDRAGCAALIAAVHALRSDLPGRDVTFVWSTEEEVGLKGAAAFAEQAAKENRVPDFVFAVDTFVSSDSPLESNRFADAELGKGFVIRAVDNSNIAPLQYVDRVIALAKENNIPVQYGVTGGGNDGAVFTRYGSVDIPLGWPLRYSHSPGEVIDTKDLDALGKIVEVIARNW